MIFEFIILFILNILVTSLQLFTISNKIKRILNHPMFEKATQVHKSHGIIEITTIDLLVEVGLTREITNRLLCCFHNFCMLFKC